MELDHRREATLEGARAGARQRPAPRRHARAVCEQRRLSLVGVRGAPARRAGDLQRDQLAVAITLLEQRVGIDEAGAVVRRIGVDRGA